MSNIIPFEFEGVPVRVVDQDGDPWWVAVDACRAIDIANTGNATARLDDDEKATIQIMDSGRPVQLTIISLPGLWKLIQTSRKPAAKRLDRWVRHDVLPSIQKTGSYVLPGAEQPVSIELFKKTWELIGVQFATQGAAIQRVETAVAENTTEIVKLHEKVDGLAPRRKDFPKKTQDQYAVTCDMRFDGKCCCGCGRPIMKQMPGAFLPVRVPDDEVYRIDHLNGRHRMGPRDGLPVHKICNQEFENKPSLRERLAHRAAVFHEEREKLFPERKLG